MTSAPVDRTAPLVVAVAQPVCVPRDPAANARTHADVVLRAGARVVVFPELSLTGYDLRAPAVDLADDLWRPLVRACARAGTLALVGAPVAGAAGTESIATVAVDGTGVRVAYRKVWLHGTEAVRFTPGPGPAVVEVDGWRLGLAICRDVGVAEHVTATAALGVDAVVAGIVDLPEDLPVQRGRARDIARSCGVPVAFASAAGPCGPGYERTAGGSAVRSPDGGEPAGCGTAAGEFATAVLHRST